MAEIRSDRTNSTAFTHAVGEGGNDKRYTTLAVGEEGEASIAIRPESGEDKVSTLRVGEEGDDPEVPPHPITIDPINNLYNRLLELIKKILKRLGNNTGVGIGFPPIIDPNPIEYYPKPIVGKDYTNSMPRSIDSASVRVEHAYLPEAE